MYDFYYQKKICFNMQEIPLVVIFQVPLGGFYKKRKKLSTVQTDLIEHTKMIAPPPPPTLNLAAFMYVPLGLVCEFFVTLTHEPFSIVYSFLPLLLFPTRLPTSVQARRA